MTNDTKYARRTSEQMIADLQAKIDSIKTRDVRKQAKANPAVKLTVGAVKLLDKALIATDNEDARRTIENARESLGAYVAAQGWSIPQAAAAQAEPAKKRGRPRKNNTAMATAS